MSFFQGDEAQFGPFFIRNDGKNCGYYKKTEEKPHDCNKRRRLECR